MKKWIAFFSQTGTEICDIASEANRIPDIIVTNAPEDRINSRVLELGSKLIRVPSKPTSAQYREVIGDDADGVFVTLHGWLRIIPADICEMYPIYNGHPGLITKYPELKGKDPQERITKEMTHIGSVIHRVTAGVDEGEVIIECSLKNSDDMTIDHYYGNLRELSLDTWDEFFKSMKP